MIRPVEAIYTRELFNNTNSCAKSFTSGGDLERRQVPIKYRDVIENR